MTDAKKTNVVVSTATLAVGGITVTITGQMAHILRTKVHAATKKKVLRAQIKKTAAKANAEDHGKALTLVHAITKIAVAVVI